MPRDYVRTPIPVWANELCSRVCADFSTPLPSLVWYQWPKNPWTRGRARKNGRIMIKEGKNPVDTYRVLLHELAHSIEFERIGKSSHGPNFYSLCWRLYLHYGADIEHCISSEFYYKVSAKPALLKLGLRMTKKQILLGEIATLKRGMHTYELKLITVDNKLKRARSPKSVDLYLRQHNILLSQWKTLDRKCLEKKALLERMIA